jgi:acylphosphatase
MIRRTVWFTGRVQGVGFRATTRSIAAAYAVSGYVMNLADGRVEAVVEGEEREVEAFLAELSQRMRYYIQSSQSADGPATGQYRSFEIAR